MGKVSNELKMKLYYKIYEQLYESPATCNVELSRRTNLCRNTVARYLNEMYASGILTSPFLSLKSVQPYAEYISLLNFDSMHFVSPRLKTFPGMVNTTHCALDWNQLAVASKPLNFQSLKYFRSQLFQGRIERVVTPKCALSSGVEIPSLSLIPKRNPPKHCIIPWNEEGWDLYNLVRSNTRAKATPLLKKVKVRYDVFSSWKKTLAQYTTTHLLFYPHGRGAYTHWYFLVKSPYDLSTLFQQWPASCVLMELGMHILLKIPVCSPLQLQTLLTLFEDFQDNSIIQLSFHAVGLDTPNNRARIP